MDKIYDLNGFTGADADRLLDEMKAERAAGYRTLFTVLETGKTYEVKDHPTLAEVKG